MRLTALVLATGLLWPASTFAQDDGSSSSSYLTGNKLYEECNSQDYSLCLGYVMGVSDALNATKPNLFCAPVSVKATQELAAVVKLPARPSRNLALQCLDRRRSGSCDGVPLQVTVCRPNSPAAPVGPTRHRAMMARKSVSNFKTRSLLIGSGKGGRPVLVVRIYIRLLQTVNAPIFRFLSASMSSRD